jgi:hypothetical protein
MLSLVPGAGPKIHHERILMRPLTSYVAAELTEKRFKKSESPKTKAVEAQESGQKCSICCGVPAISAHETLLGDILDSFITEF